MKVLVVDDDEWLMTELAEFFRRQGCGVATGSSGLDAVRLVPLEQPDLLIMDVQMPEMDGLEAVAELRRAGHGLLRIVLMSGDRNGLEKARLLECVTVLEKPFRIAELKQLVQP